MKVTLPTKINLSAPEKYILTVYVHPEKYSFSIHSPGKPKSYFFYQIDSPGQADAFSGFKDLFFENEFFSYPFQKTCILVFTPLFTFVPNAIYSHTYKTDFVKFIFSEENKTVLEYTVLSAKLTILYPVSETVCDFFIRSLNKPEFVHYSAPLITYFLSPDVKHKTRQMIVNVHEKGIDVLCFSRKTFLLGNHFPCEKNRDAIYYILYAWKQLKLDRFADSLFVTGTPPLNEELVQNLRLYIRHVYQGRFPKKKQFENINAGNIPFELAAFSLCES